MIYEGITFKDYLKLEGFNSSLLKPYSKSPRYGYWSEHKERKKSKEMSIGKLAHALILEGREAFNKLLIDDYILSGAPVNPKTGVAYGNNTKKFNDWWDKQDQAKQFITEEDLKEIEFITEAVISHSAASTILKRCDKRESAITWTCKYTGVKCKALIDLYGHVVGADLKTISKDLKKSILESEMYNRQYHLQFSFYEDGLEANGINIDDFYVIFAQNKSPYDVACMRVNYTAMDQGREDYIKAIGNYNKAREEGDQKTGAYPNIETIGIPYYAIEDNDEDFDNQVKEAYG